jgi:mono/diheme cytochrome c family protein
MPLPIVKMGDVQKEAVCDRDVGRYPGMTDVIKEAIMGFRRYRPPVFLAIGILVLGAAGWIVAEQALGDGIRANPTDREQVALGERIYQANCASCHGADLEGQPDWKQRLPDGTMPAPPHDDSGHTWHHPDQQLFDYTKLGGAAVVQPPFKSAMPGFGQSLSDDEIWAVLAFIKSRWSQRARAVQRQRSLQQ